MSQFDYVKARREDVAPIPEKHAALVHKIIRTYTRFNVWVFKKSGGRLMKTWPGGYPICLVETTGARSGAKREIALIHVPKGDDILLVASEGGMNRHPSWYYNITRHPDITITANGSTRAMHARRISAEEKRELWPLITSVYPDYDEYQARTDRDIPVFRCSAR